MFDFNNGLPPGWMLKGLNLLHGCCPENGHAESGTCSKCGKPAPGIGLKRWTLSTLRDP